MRIHGSRKSRPQRPIADSQRAALAAKPSIGHLQHSLGNQTLQRLLENRASGLASASLLAASDSPAIVQQVMQTHGQRLDPGIRAEMESRFAHDFRNVEIHVGTDSVPAAEALAAKAYTVGHHIVFGSGEYAPQTPRGQRLIAHELAHVVQQSRGGAVPSAVTSDPLERDAERAATAVTQGSGPVPVAEASGVGIACQVEAAGSGDALHELAGQDLDTTLQDADLPPLIRPRQPKAQDLTAVKLIVDGGTSLLQSVLVTHWRSRAELERFMQNYIDVAAAEPDKQTVAEQARHERETVRQQLQVAEADVLAGRWKLAEGKEHAQEQAALLKVPVPEVFKPTVAVGQFLGIPSAKAADVLLDFVPWVGEIKMLAEAASGMTISGEIDKAIEGTPDIDNVDRVMRLFPIALRAASGILSRAPGWADTLAKVKGASRLSDEAVSKALSDIQQLKGREQEVARALVAVRERQQAAAAERFRTFLAGSEREAGGTAGATEPPARAGGPVAGTLAEPAGPFRALATGQSGKVFLGKEMVTTLIDEHPNLAGIRASLQQHGVALVPEPGMAKLERQATANVAYVRVSGTDGADFARAVISYDPKHAVLQDLWHEMNHLLDFRTGKLPPTFTITAEDAIRFEELKGKSAQELLALAKAMPRAAVASQLEASEALARHWVAEMRNHLRDIEELPTSAGSAYVENAQKAVKTGLEILKHLVETGQIGALDSAARQELKQYIRNFIDTKFPELPGAYEAVFPRQANPWKFLD